MGAGRIAITTQQQQATASEITASMEAVRERVTEILRNSTS
jgi:hypothetical protein